MLKTSRLYIVSAVLCCVALTRALAQVSGSVTIIPAPNSNELTDLNDVVLFRSAGPGNQAFDGAVDAAQYLVGPGDRIEINIWTPFARNFDLTVTPEGTLLIPSYGELKVADLTLDSARTKILDSLGDEFPASEISATLTQARPVRVYVSGAVGRPGTYVLVANQRLADAVSAAGGILPDRGSVRNIEHTTSIGRRTADLWRFYALGDPKENPYLAGGDFVRVVPRESRADQLQVAGAVRTPGIIEYRAGDRVSDLIRFADGFATHADLARVTLTSTDFGTGQSRAFELRVEADSTGFTFLDDMPLKRGDRLFAAYESSAGRTATVALYGEILRPGHYAVVEDSTTLYALIEAAGGLKPRASPHEAVFLRPSHRTFVAGDSARALVSTYLDELLAGNLTYDVPLKNGDSIFIPARSLAVQVVGRVRRPGILTYQPGQAVREYLERAGGYAADADRRAVRVIRAVSGAVEKPDGNWLPMPGDQILVPAKTPTSIGRKIRDGVTFVSALATTYFVLREISK